MFSNDLINVSHLTILSDEMIPYHQDEPNTIEADIAAAQRGRGRRQVVQAVGSLITRQSPSPSTVRGMYSASPHMMCTDDRFQAMARTLGHTGARTIPRCPCPVTVQGTWGITLDSMSRAKTGPERHLQLGT